MKLSSILILSCFLFGMIYCAGHLYPLVNPLCKKIVSGSRHSEIHWALLCGNRAEHPKWTLAMKKLGIFHLLVVSGAHFSIFSDLLLIFLPPKWRLIISFVLLSVWGSAMPILRSFLWSCLRCLSDYFSLNWNKNLLFILSLILSLLYLQEVWELRSLWLSAWVSFCLIHFSQHRKSWKSKLVLQSFLFLSLSYILPGSSEISLLSIPINLFLSSFLLIVLFLCAVLHPLFSVLHICDSIMHFLFSSLDKLAGLNAIPSISNSLELEFCLGLCLLCIAIRYLPQKTEGSYGG